MNSPLFSSLQRRRNRDQMNACLLVCLSASPRLSAIMIGFHLWSHHNNELHSSSPLWRFHWDVSFIVKAANSSTAWSCRLPLASFFFFFLSQKISFYLKDIFYILQNSRRDLVPDKHRLRITRSGECFRNSNNRTVMKFLSFFLNVVLVSLLLAQEFKFKRDLHPRAEIYRWKNKKNLGCDFLYC